LICYDLDDAGDYIYELIGIADADESLSASGLDFGVDVSYIIKNIASGNFQDIWTYMAVKFKSLLVSEISENGQLMLALIIIIILGAVFTRLTKAYGNPGISEIGFFVTYILMTSVCFMSFNLGTQVVEGAVKALVVLLRIMVPVFMVAMNFTGHVVSASSAYQLVMLGIWLVQAVFLKALIPLIRFYVIMSMLNGLNREKYFSRLTSIAESVVYFSLKTVVVFVAGLNLIKGLIGPQLESIGKSSINRVVNALTGSGINGVLTGTFLASGLVIKNSVGVAIVCLMLILFMGPVIKIFILKIMVRFSAAIVQPVGDKRYMDGMDTVYKGFEMLLKLMYTSLVLFILSIAVVAFTTNS
jgi:stage III sporulation protein AE